MVDVAGRHVTRDRGERLRFTGDQRGHPVFICKADPAVFRDIDHFRRGAFTLDKIQIREVVIGKFVQCAVRFANHAFMKNEEVLQIRGQPVARNDAVGRHAGGGIGRVFDRLRDLEHEVFVDRDATAEDQAITIVPDQGDGCLRCEGLATFDLPFGIRARHIFKRQIAGGGPAIEGIIRLGFADGRQERDGRAVLFKGLEVVI